MKLVINSLVGENLSLKNVIDILDEYSPQDEHITISLDTRIGKTIQASCKRSEWVTTKEKFLLLMMKEQINFERKCSFFNRMFHI